MFDGFFFLEIKLKLKLKLKLNVPDKSGLTVCKPSEMLLVLVWSSFHLIMLVRQIFVTCCYFVERWLKEVRHVSLLVSVHAISFDVHYNC